MSKQKRYWQTFVGFNYRMAIEAAVGVAQLERLDDILSKKIWILEQYQILKDCSFIELYPNYPDHIVHSNWPILVSNNIPRDNVLDKLLQRGIECRPVFILSILWTLINSIVILISY